MFHSTRGNTSVSSSKAIWNGLAEDGGLYVVDAIPKLDYHDLLQDDYQTMTAKILHLFFPEFTYEELYQEIKEAYSSFDIQDVVAWKKTKNAYFLELFHGPTLAFKDLALVVLPRLMKLAKKKLGFTKNLTILTATSGDTGGAALNGFHNIDGISIIVLYPNGGVSLVQEAQMCSFRNQNAHVLAVDGNFDDCQTAVKKIFQEHQDLPISSANSINIGRLIPQIVYYYASYIKLLKSNQIQNGEKINFVVPTGNFGNIFAAFYAKKMGLPIQDLICASNKNKVLTDYFMTGTYNKNRLFYKTNSSSMDILISSNLERLLYYINKENIIKTNQQMQQLKETGQFELTNTFKEIKAYTTDEEETLETIRSLYKESGYLVDPHTAVAYHAYLGYLKDDSKHCKTVIVSTASPFKFPEIVLQAFGKSYDNSLTALKELSKEFQLKLPKQLNYPPVQKTVVALEDVEKKVLDVIKC